MNLEDALGGWPTSNPNQSQGGGGAWPGPQQPPNPTWPGQPSGPGGWPAPTGPGQPSGPGGWPAPTGPGQPSGPGGWPAATGPGQPSAPGGWPAPTGPGQPSGPGGWPAPAPSQPSGPGGWPAPAPSQPSGPGGWPAPAPAPGPTAPTYPAAPQMSLALPLNYPLPHGLENKTITIKGTVKRNANMFTIDFCRGSDIAFHFNPRFNEGGNKVMVRNSMFGQKWGKEERIGHFPFSPGQNFDMKIDVTRSGYKITVNGSHVPEYKHRNVNPRDIKQINIYNDITLSHFNVN